MGESVLTLLGRNEVWIAGAALGAFLLLTWVLRGAAPGRSSEAEDDAEAPRAGYRDRMVVSVVAGLLLILGGAYVALERGIPWSLPLFALGFGLVLALIRVNRRYRHASPSLRRTMEFSSAFLNASLLAGILIVLNVIAFRYGSRPLDLTRERTYSLSDMTLNQLTRLDRPVTFTLIFGRGPVATSQRDRVVQLLESYRTINPQRIQVVSLDPYYDLARAEELAKRAPELGLLHGGGVLVEYGEGSGAEYVVVRNQEMFEPIGPDQARGGFSRFESVFTGEDAITSALIRLREGKKSKVAFTRGHGEPDMSDLNPGGKGLGNWKTRLTRVGCDVVELNLLDGKIPDDLALLIVVGPSSPFKPDELAKLRVYADGGGPILLLLGRTRTTESDPTLKSFDELLRSFNLEIGRGLVFDAALNFRGNPYLVFAPSQGGPRHPIVGALDPNRLVWTPTASPIHIRGQGAGEQPHGGAATEPVNRNLVPVPILKTSNNSWAENELTNPRPSLDRTIDEPGPITVGVAVAQRTGEPRSGIEADQEQKPRLVLFSSAAMGENIVQEVEPTNLDLLMNAASWLRGRPDTLGIAPNTHVALTLRVDPQLRQRLILVPTVTALMLIIAVGLVVYVARRE